MKKALLICAFASFASMNAFACEEERKETEVCVEVESSTESSASETCSAESSDTSAACEATSEE